MGRYEEGVVEDTIYSEDNLADQMENDQISDFEEAFMRGYDDAAQI